MLIGPRALEYRDPPSGRSPTRRRVYDYTTSAPPSAATGRESARRGAEPLVASGQAAAPAVNGGGGGTLTCRAALERRLGGGRRVRAGVFFPRAAMAYAARHRRDESTSTVAPIAGGRTSRRPGPRPGPRCAVNETEETTGLLSGRRTPGKTGPSFGAGFVGFRTLSSAAVAARVFHAGRRRFSGHARP